MKNTRGNALVGLLILTSLIGGIGWLVLNLPSTDVFAETLQEPAPQQAATELRTNPALFISHSDDDDQVETEIATSSTDSAESE